MITKQNVRECSSILIIFVTTYVHFLHWVEKLVKCKNIHLIYTNVANKKYYNR